MNTNKIKKKKTSNICRVREKKVCIKYNHYKINKLRKVQVFIILMFFQPFMLEANGDFY